LSYSAIDLERLCGVRPTHVIHVGAWEGVDVPDYLELKIPMITLIEALPEKAKLLRAKYATYENIEILEYAASDTSGEFVNFYPLNYGSSSLLKPNLDSLREIFVDFTEMEAIKVQTLKLDDISTRAVDQIMLIIDVQGAELQVLSGAISVLEKTLLIKVEVSTVTYYDGQSYQAQIEHFLKSQGFVKISQRITKTMGQGDAIFVRKRSFRIVPYLKIQIMDLRWKLSIQEFNLHRMKTFFKFRRNNSS
jgi:FkbM family methyltransferase